MKTPGPRARRALAIVAQGKTLRTPALRRAWANVVAQGRAGAVVREYRKAQGRSAPGRPSRPVQARPAQKTTRHTAPAPPAPTKTTKKKARVESESVDHLISFRFHAGRKSYRRDLVVPAPRGTSLSALVRQAQDELPHGADALRPFLTTRHAEVIEGPRTSRSRTEAR